VIAIAGPLVNFGLAILLAGVGLIFGQAISLTHTRLLEALDSYGPDTPVVEVMLTDITPVTPKESMFAVQQRLSEDRLDALPVADGKRFLGLITNRDISEVYRMVSSHPNLLPTPKVS